MDYIETLSKNNQNKAEKGAEMAQWFKALAEDPSSILRHHIEAHNHL